MHTKIRKDWFSHSEVDKGNDVQTHKQTARISHKPTSIFLKIRKVD
jgi:hypothetical protein